MAMNAGTMKNEIVAALNAEFGTDYDEIPDSHLLTGYDQATYWNRYWGAVSAAIVNHIASNAKATGNDSRGDTHNLDIA